jgi:hypothetical protein
MVRVVIDNSHSRVGAVQDVVNEPSPTRHRTYRVPACQESIPDRMCLRVVVRAKFRNTLNAA